MKKRHEVGQRVGAIMKGEKDTVWVFGYGTYQGDQVPDPALGIRFLGSEMDWPNPCIRLDSGKLVSGCECWWGPEEQVRETVSAYGTVIEADIEEERRKMAPVKDE